MAVLLVKPRYALSLWRQGLRTVRDYMSRLEGVRITRHHGREVSWLALDGVQGFLKKQFRIPVKDFFSSWWGGFGWVSRSRREWQVLHLLRERQMLCPEPIAVGESGQEGFLLTSRLPHCIDLPTFLRSGPTSARRWQVLKRLGARIADLHDAGFDHPDLYAKHIFIDERTGDVGFVDFQRTCRHPWGVAWSKRWRDLAALHASLDDTAVTPTERLGVLVAYLKRNDAIRCRPLALRGLLAISRRAEQLLRRRKVRALRAATAMSDEPIAIFQYRLAMDKLPAATPEAKLEGRGRIAC
ncbi:MAG TPA: lipopolysaccharide kinase InaA family protein [Gemmatales bacterium]|nr:lipopolysaccharide kinase InaA family protein [Gemmatales bacterium]HMP60436.1 lipopolysaccharide kinase InaA family protein [Gemmatales bacterium]